MRYVYWIAIALVLSIVLGALNYDQILEWGDYKRLEQSDASPPSEVNDVSVPAWAVNADLEDLLETALNAVPHQQNDTPVRPLAEAIASKLKDYPVEYNKPASLLLGESTPVQLVIKTSEKQDAEPLFKGLEGDVAKTTVMVANDVSAQLSGPPDRLDIKLRDEKNNMRTISSPVPITWIWDVKPLKPGEAQVTLEVTSYIKTGKDTEPVPIRVLQDTWVVEAHGIAWVRYQIAQIDPILAFVATLGTLGAGVLAWFGFKGWGKSKPDLDT